MLRGGRKRASLTVDATVDGGDGDRAPPASDSDPALPAAAAAASAALMPTQTPHYLHASPVAAAAMYQQLLQQQLAYQQLQTQAQAQAHAHAQAQAQQQQLVLQAQAADYELLEDFCAFLECRVLTRDLPLLRRVMLEFLARQEHALADFKRFGANLIALLPFEVADAATRQRAALLLQKQRNRGDTGGAKVAAGVFDFLRARVATKNLELFRRMFAEFRGGSDDALATFVKHGGVGVSIIPCEPDAVPANRFPHGAYGLPQQQPPQLLHLPPSPPAYAHLQHIGALMGYPSLHQQHQHQHQYLYQFLQHAPYTRRVEQEQSASEPGATPKHERAKKIVPSRRQRTSPPHELSERASATSTTEGSDNGRVAAEVVVRPGKRAVRRPVLFYKEQEASAAGVARRVNHAKREHDGAVNGGEADDDDDDDDDQDEDDDDDEDDDEDESSRPVRRCANVATPRAKSARKTASGNLPPHRRRGRRFTGGGGDAASRHDKTAVNRMIDETIRLLVKEKEPTPPPPPRDEGGRRLINYRTNNVPLELRVEIRDRMLAYEASEPWKTVYADLPLPFERKDAPALADKLELFWQLHGRAAWERDFWAPLAPDGDSKENVARKARQQTSRSMFDAIIRTAFARFGAAFFVRLDAQRHPGWWYRRTIVDIQSYHQLVGAEQCWKYVETQLTARFPDCGLPLPLPSANAAVLGKGTPVSDSMWSVRKFAAPIEARIRALKKANARASARAGVPDSSDSDDVELRGVRKRLRRSGEPKKAIVVQDPSEAEEPQQQQQRTDEGDDREDVLVVDANDSGDVASLSTDEDEREERPVEEIALASEAADKDDARSSAGVVDVTDNNGASRGVQLESELAPSRFAELMHEILPLSSPP